MNPYTPVGKKIPLPKPSGKPPGFSRKTKPGSFPTPVVLIMSTPKPGGNHNTHTLFLGGGVVKDYWEIDGRYQYSTRCRDEKYLENIEKHLIEKRDASGERKFNGTLDNGNDKELDNDQFVRALKQKVCEYGHENFYAVGCTAAGTIMVHDVITDYHMFTVNEMIDRYADRKLSSGPDIREDIEEDGM
jgi:hypothetical protein